MYSVSVIVPAYNAEKTLNRCIKSIMNQTLKDIEIIIVNDGSTDDTLKAAKMLSYEDERIKVVNQIENHGTGYSINHGIMCATGTYIGEVDCDDWIEPEMYEGLFSRSKGMDIVKSGYKCEAEGKTYEMPITDKEYVFCPRLMKNKMSFFGFQPSYWSAIYRRDFMQCNTLLWNETEGASFQDTSAIFKANALANHVKVVPECYYHWVRHENESTMNQYNHPNAIIGEYQTIKDFLRKRPELQLPLTRIALANEVSSYMWNLSRIATELKRDFIIEAAAELRKQWEYFDIRLLNAQNMKILKMWMEEPEAFADWVVEHDEK